MALFDYTGRSDRGKRISGQIEAQSASAAALRLQASGLVPIEITARNAAEFSYRKLLLRLGFGQPTTMELVLLTRQMYTIAKSGLPWLRGLRGLAGAMQNPVLRATLERAAISLAAGRDLSQALSENGAVFPELYISMLRVGEQTGTMEKVLLQLADYLQNQQDMRDRVKAALRYPAIVIGAICVSMGVLSVFVIPKFAPMFKQLGNDLPLPTKIMLAVSSFAQQHWLLVMATIAAVVVSFMITVRTTKGRAAWHRCKLQFYLFGRLTLESILARVVRSLSLTLAAGLPIIQALDLIARAADNDFVSAKITVMREKLESGEPLSRAATDTQLFPPLLLQMIEVGEETGELTRLLDEVADYYHREVDYTLKNLSAMIEPVLMVVVGGLVLLLALGIFLPMWEMIGKAGGTH